ncbi:single-stranded-DNA-specific exonuclease RecJ [Anaerolinea thermophila]|uniref:Single-stranded-DNA-specific exonuclease RecJ n=1 Tax=Anaerolinea thermophila (strain DSM 14523 / JCM 11388 / NBRC 100420 / UNI-1) TaxID=926569 RepID=E8N1B6_ANATU|nr:single-stranded-DNA-specific exonuclease RecJ [Anaerolinea thermophila]BAJ64859.1 single-stranded-DNA-specific exonuclease [Anaerolinea thermophila UNI-1]
MFQWIEPRENGIPAALLEVTGGQGLIARILAHRGITDPQRARAFLNPAFYQPAPPEDLPGMEIACQRISRAIQRGERIWVWGDFDVDGQTATALLVQTLRWLGAEPRYHVPVRETEGHGVNIPYLEKILEQGADLMITCDTGITAFEALEYARERSLEVIVTDHHLLGERLPPALTHLTPRLLPENHPMCGLPGVGVAYQLALALLTRAGQPERAQELLDLVALGIVADVALQIGDTRYLLQQGLQELRRGKRLGVRAVLERAEVSRLWLNEEHLGFVLAPRLNALGRLGDANPAVELLTTTDEARARVLAEELEILNMRRQFLTAQVLAAAEDRLRTDSSLLRAPVLILENSQWAPGVIGIAASHLAQRYHRPVILMSASSSGILRGSARSIEGVDITAAITACKDLLIGFGGHPMAAGLALMAEQLPAFRACLTRQVQAQVDALGGLPERTLQLEAVLRLEEIHLKVAEALEQLAPFGPGNPTPALMVPDVRISNVIAIGRNDDHLRITVEDRMGNERGVLWWNGANADLPEGWFDLACTLRASTYQGTRDVQVEWLDWRPRQVEQIDLYGMLEVMDYRAEAHPLPLLERMMAEAPYVQVWGEGEALEHLSQIARDRTALQPADMLIVWTVPPSNSVLRKALEQVKPKQVVLFGVNPQTEETEPFLQRLAGLVKFMMRQKRTVTLEKLAGLTAQSEAAVRLGLCYLEACGFVRVRFTDTGVIISEGTRQPTGEAPAYQKQLQTALEETAAYRRFYLSAQRMSLFS